MGCSQPRPCSGVKTVRRCRNRRETDNVVLIDVDSDSFPNVIIIDVPESLQNKLRGSSVLRNDRKGPWATVICLDDDEGTDDNNSDPGVEVDEIVKNGASSSKRACSAPRNDASSSNSVADDCQFIRENVSPVKLSKGKRTYSRKGPANRYGLSADSESSSSDSDYVDCESMEGPSGRLREQWEKASSKRKCDTRNGRSDTKDPEMVFNGAHRNGNLANGHGEPKKTAESKEKEPPAQSIPKEDGDLGSKADPPCRRGAVNGVHPFGNAEHHSGQFFEKGGSSFHNEEEQVPRRADSVPFSDWGTRKVNRVEKVWQNKKEPYEIQCQNPVNQDFGKSVSGDKGKISQETITENTSKNTNDLINRVQPVRSHSCSVSANEEPMRLVSNSQMEDKGDDLGHSMDCDVPLNSEGCILSEREKLKETDEYKKALEEEWASRQRALQIQAEEAQNLRRLRKRRKAESMRLLDMERRQKQRVEEIRETQKKDEENMNLKEVIRAAVRKELNELELTCHDMASLLRGLGVLVGVVGQSPSSNEVRLAYKRALLTFHPDRASGSDIRKQVEAEEKFKLISRMKDKFLPT